MIFNLLGILILSVSWLRALPIFIEYIPSSSWMFAGVALLIVGLRRHARLCSGIGTGTAVVAVFISILGISWLDGPFQTGFWLLGLASLLRLVPLIRSWFRWVLPGLWLSAVITIVQSALIPLLYVFCSRYHSTAEIPILHDLLPGNPSLPWLAALLYLPLKLINGSAALNGSTLYFSTAVDTVGLTPTWEKLGLIPLALFGSGAVALLLLRPDWRRRLGGLIVCLLVYGYLRLIFMLLLVTHVREANVFWHLDFLFLSFLPLPLLLSGWWWLGKRHSDASLKGNADQSHYRAMGRLFSWLTLDNDTIPEFSPSNRPARIILASILFAGGLTAFWGFHDPGTPKKGRILIEEAHSDWEWTTQPFDTTWYGGKSGYNYYCLADYWNHYYHVETHRDSLTPELLEKWDVLVIKTPTSHYSPDEVDAIVDFVREGGGLFLIGDHTNVFGTSTHLNRIAEKFGMYFRYDATYKIATLGLSLYERPHRFTHPVVYNMPNYLFATSCTLYSPFFSENVILGYGLRAMYLDYSEHSYFPKKEEKVNYDFGLFVQAGGIKFGKGRVLGYTDSTCFSNFFMFIPGKPELALASIEWLNRMNRWAWLGRVFLLLSLVGAFLLVREALRNSGVMFLSMVTLTGALTVIALGSILETSVKRSYALPQPHRSPVTVTFDHKHGYYLLPAERLAIPNWQNFQTFYVWTQRLGLVPRDVTSIDEAIENSAAFVEIHPFQSFSIDDLDKIVEYVHRGGTLIVLDSPLNSLSTASQILGPFQIAFDMAASDSVTVLNARGDTLGFAPSAFGVEDVVPLLKLANGRTTMGYRTIGKGKVVVCGAAYIFSTESMGNTAVVPDERRKRLFRAEYDLFEKTAGLRAKKRYYMSDW